MFITTIKYPRTFHLPFSQGATSDDKILKSLDSFVGKEIVITTKMDGENTTLYNNTYHARSIDGRSHPSRSWVAQFHSTIAHNIPENWRICGENLFAKHSIHYNNLQSYFMGFSIWNDENVCLSWNDTLEYFDMLGIIPVQELFKGTFDEQYIRNLAKSFNTSLDEGFVVRLATEFHYTDFNKSVGKWVRRNHVTSQEHWMHSKIIENTLQIC